MTTKKEFKAVGIDADILLYKAAYQATYEWIIEEEELAGIQVDLREGFQTYQEMVSRVLEAFPGKPHVVHYLSSPSVTGWRRDFFPAYKGNRTGPPLPGLKALKQMVMDRLPHARVPRLEADDLLGMRATADPDFCIVSTDKDMATVPGWWFNPDKMEEPQRQPEGLADLALYTQALTGDTTDGYPGCKGLGPVKAAKVFQGAPMEPAILWDLTKRAFEKAGFDEEFAISQVMCARILRHGDMKGEVVTWRPGR